MSEDKYLTIPQVAKMLGISRIAVYKKVKNGQIKADRIGRSYVINHKQIFSFTFKKLTKKDVQELDTAIRKAIKEYGETFRLLGQE